MERKVAIGIQNFYELREDNYFYIDKTHFIKEWWEGGDEVTLITRPRRFGKTLTMSMVEQFFSIKYAKQENVFEKLNIWKLEKYRNLQGTYPVISLSFANIKGKCFETVRSEICQILTNLYIQNSFLKDSDILVDKDKDFIDRVSVNMSDSDAAMSLHLLCDYLYRYYGKKVIVLLDEYDTPMQEAYINGFWEELVSFTRGLFNATFKTNPYLERGIMTGITRVSKESIFSDLNNLEVVTTTSNKYADDFGFTETEVFCAMDEFGMIQKEEVKQWYDGFVFGKVSDIYNPWSIINFLDKGVLNTYWANTSANSLVGKLLQEASSRTKEKFEMLLSGKTIKSRLDEQIVYDQLNASETAIWSLLLASGYLKMMRKESLVTTRNYRKSRECELMLTNFEVQLMFEDLVIGWFGKAESDYNDFIKALLLRDIQAMNTYMNRVALKVFSYFDVGNRPSGAEPERFYHGFVLGLLVELSDQYIVTSNRESGFGRYDVLLEPLDKSKDGIILEFKIHDSEKEKNLQDTVNSALKQIEEKQYEQVLLEHGVLKKNICKYGFAFEGKTVLIG